MAEKKYYWLKLKSDFFKSKEIKKLRSMAGGDTYTIIYLKMLLSAMQKEGLLCWEQVEDSFEAEIALDIDENLDDVRMTLYYLESKRLIEAVNPDSLILPYAIENTGNETSAAARMRKSRAKAQKKALKCNNVTPMLHSCDTEKEKEKEKDTPALPKRKECEIWDPEAFEAFWALYPKKKDKVKAIEEWNKLKANRELMMKMSTALKTQMASEEWQRDNGRAIPYPCRWLSHRRWEDENAVPAAVPARREEAPPEWI